VARLVAHLVTIVRVGLSGELFQELLQHIAHASFLFEALCILSVLEPNDHRILKCILQGKQKPKHHMDHTDPRKYDSVYYDPNPDPMNNLTNYGANNSQMFQLNLDGLMPASWSGGSGGGVAGSTPNHPPQASGMGQAMSQDDWYRYAPDKKAVSRYITSAGATRFSTITRNPNGRLFGQSNPLRTNPPVPLSNSEITFNNSENRQALIDSLGGSQQWA
jgi:hypothetical protein